MPYVPQSQRLKIKSGKLADAGAFNYSLTELVNSYIEQRGTSYQTYNDIVGAIECCKMEIYRRSVAPYEDRKALQNGDVQLFQK